MRATLFCGRDIDTLTSRERKASKTVALPGATFVPPAQRQTSCFSLPNQLAFYAAHSCRILILILILILSLARLQQA